MSTFPIDGQSYYLLNIGALMTLDLTGGGSAPNTPCLGWTPHFDQVAQNRVWTFISGGTEPSGRTVWTIRNRQSQTFLDLDAQRQFVVGNPKPQGQGQPASQCWYVETAAESSGQVQDYA